MGLADDIGMYWAGAEVMYGVILAMTCASVLRGYPIVLETSSIKVSLQHYSAVLPGALLTASCISGREIISSDGRTKQSSSPNPQGRTNPPSPLSGSIWMIRFSGIFPGEQAAAL